MKRAEVEELIEKAIEKESDRTHPGAVFPPREIWPNFWAWAAPPSERPSTPWWSWAIWKQSRAKALRAGSNFDPMEARQLLESRSAALAAQRAEKSHIRKLKNSIQNLKTAGQDYTVFLKADIAFHDAVAEATGNVVIREMTKLIPEKLVGHHSNLNTKQLSEKYGQKSVSTAAKVVECIRNQDEKNASLWMEKHLNAITAELKNIIE